jgi:hypothetical protein
MAIQPKGVLLYAASLDPVSGSFQAWKPVISDDDGQLQIALRGGGVDTVSVYELSDVSQTGGSALSPAGQLVLGTLAFPGLINDANDEYQAQRRALSADASAVTNGVALTAARGQAFNGSTYDRLRTNSAATLAGSTQPFAALSASPGEWSINHTPVDNTQATITRAAGAAGVRHVCRSVSATLIGLAAAVEATVLVNLRDGATGAGTILRSWRFLVVGGAGSQVGVELSGLNILGSAATAMTLEFAAAGGADTFETVALSGYDTV